eukprot:4261415-Prymnesium_polylepis.1
MAAPLGCGGTCLMASMSGTATGTPCCHLAARVWIHLVVNISSLLSLRRLFHLRCTALAMLLWARASVAAAPRRCSGCLLCRRCQFSTHACVHVVRTRVASGRPPHAVS